MGLLDRIFGTRSAAARARLAYRLLLDIAALDRPTPAPARVRSRKESGRVADRRRSA